MYQVRKFWNFNLSQIKGTFIFQKRAFWQAKTAKYKNHIVTLDNQTKGIFHFWKGIKSTLAFHINVRHRFANDVQEEIRNSETYRDSNIWHSQIYLSYVKNDFGFHPKFPDWNILSWENMSSHLIYVPIIWVLACLHILLGKVGTLF